jgi:hypothetical protein
MKTQLFDTECTTLRSREKHHHLSVTIISLKIAFLKGTDRCFSRRYGKLSGTVQTYNLGNEKILSRLPGHCFDIVCFDIVCFDIVLTETV